MKNHPFHVFTLTMILLLNACSPVTITRSEGEQPTPVISSETQDGNRQSLVVEDVQIEVGVGSPLPVEIVASGTWPDLCSQIADVKSQITGFQIDVTILSSTVSPCPPDLVGLPFRFALPLNIVEMEAGTYTVTVNGISTTLELPIEQAPATGSISGWVWHDECLPGQDGQPAPTSPPPGCVEDLSQVGLYYANGVLESNEKPIEGVVVRLLEGDCSSAGPGIAAETQTLAADISYSFTGLQAGTYCVSIDPLVEANIGILVPGGWTYPQVADGPIGTTVNLQPQENKFDVNFGWDYQFK
jgi:hypothetical protein